MSELAEASAEQVPAKKGGVYALGNFDGVHRGHQAVVKAAIERARGMNVPARVLTFEPHPRTIFKPGIPPFRLTPGAQKVRLLQAMGIDDVIVRPFTVEFSKLSAQDFVQQILLQDCGAQHVIAGFDFVFGHARGGNLTNLRTWLSPHGVGVTEVSLFRDASGESMSSTRAREALQAGDLATADHILGRRWSIAGTVEHGAKLGHEMETPTANIALKDYLRPKFGVYVVQAGRVGSPIRWQGVANIGTRPTVNGETELLEFHLFDFHDDIYGQEWDVELIDFLRPEQRFADIVALREQIAKDIEQAKARLAKSY